MIKVEDLRVGMKVRVKTNIRELPDDANCGYRSQMVESENKVVTIRTYNQAYGGYVSVRFQENHDGRDLWYSNEWLDYHVEDCFDSDLFEL